MQSECRWLSCKAVPKCLFRQICSIMRIHFVGLISWACRNFCQTFYPGYTRGSKINHTSAHANCLGEWNGNSERKMIKSCSLQCIAGGGERYDFIFMWNITSLCERAQAICNKRRKTWQHNGNTASAYLRENQMDLTEQFSAEIAMVWFGFCYRFNVHLCKLNPSSSSSSPMTTNERIEWSKKSKR